MRCRRSALWSVFRSVFSTPMVLITAFAGIMALPQQAQAGGFELPGVGGVAAGRGGAYIARSDTAMALNFNPANLAILDGVQLSVNLNLAQVNACAQRTGTVTQSENPSLANDRINQFVRILQSDDLGNADIFDTLYGSVEDLSQIRNPKVCNEAGVFPIPQIAVTWRTPWLKRHKLTLGFGILAPNSAGIRRFGGKDGYVPSAQSPTGRIASPTRYDIGEESVVLAFPTIGVGAEITPWLRVGASFGSGVALINFATVAPPVAGEQAGLDLFSTLKASDWFVPKVQGSVHATPTDFLDVTLGFTWTQDINAKGDLSLDAMYFASDELRAVWENYTPAPLPPRGQTQSIKGAELAAGQPTVFSLGLRYSHPLANPVSTPVGDAMETELFDVELDVVYERNSRVGDFIINIPEGAEIIAGLINGSIPPDPTLKLDHKWKDQLSLRLGGDYNIFPGKLALRAGVSFETNGVEHGYQRLDFMPFRTFGLHAGFTARIDRTDLTFGYMHFFHQTAVVTEDEAQVRQAVGSDLLGRGYVINAGTYTASTDTVALAVGYRFK